MEIILTNPVGTIVIPQIGSNGIKKAVCKKPECRTKDLYWANSKETGANIMISKQKDNTYWSHHKDCFKPNDFSSAKKK